MRHVQLPRIHNTTHKLTTHLHQVLDAAVLVWFHDRFDPDKGLHLHNQKSRQRSETKIQTIKHCCAYVCVESVSHESEFAIWWDETDCSVILEPRKAHALMKLDVFHLHCFALAWRGDITSNHNNQQMYGTTAPTYVGLLLGTEPCRSTPASAQAYLLGRTHGW